APSTTIESLKNSSTRCELLASRCSSTPSKDPHVEKEEYHPKCALSSRHSCQATMWRGNCGRCSTSKRMGRKGLRKILANTDVSTSSVRRMASVRAIGSRPSPCYPVRSLFDLRGLPRLHPHPLPARLPLLLALWPGLLFLLLLPFRRICRRWKPPLLVRCHWPR